MHNGLPFLGSVDGGKDLLKVHRNQYKDFDYFCRISIFIMPAKTNTLKSVFSALMRTISEH